MPIYEYQCTSCSERHEFMQKINEAPMRGCPSCGEPALKKLISSSAFHLKGSGWYVTDFRDQDKKKAKPKEGEKSEKQTADGGSGDAKQDAQAKDSSAKAEPAPKAKGADKAASSDSSD